MGGIYLGGGNDNLAGEEGRSPVGSATWCKRTLLPGYLLKYRTGELEGPIARRPREFGKPSPS